MKKKTAYDVLRSMEPDCKPVIMEKFVKMLKDLMDWCKIQNDGDDIVDCLSSIENELQFMCEARNHLNWKDKLTKPSER